jgi:hypothetical protein
MIEIIELLGLNKYLMLAVVALGGAGFFYLRGRSSGKASQIAKEVEALKKIDANIRKAEAANQQTDKKRDEDVETVRNTADVPSLIELWDQITKGPRDPKA